MGGRSAGALRVRGHDFAARAGRAVPGDRPADLRRSHKVRDPPVGLSRNDAMKTTREQVLEIAAECLELPAAHLRPDAPWEEYGGDSLAVVEMVLTVQEHFRISLETAE